MNTVLRIATLAATSLLTVAGVGSAYFFSAYPAVESNDDFRVEPTPELVERGQYLVEHVAGCVDCHSERDFTRFSGPVKPGTFGKGGERFGRDLGLPGELYAKNITPAALGSWSDGELRTAITEGVGRSGEALFPLMPYPHYTHLCERDVSAIVAFLRNLPAIESDVPERELDFPVNLLIRTVPKKAEPWPCPEETRGAERGKYLTTMGACSHCHSPSNQGEPIPGKEFSGGIAISLPAGTLRTANITPDPETGIGGWTREQFVAKFRAYSNPGSATPVGPADFNTVMPWTVYGGMTEDDLGAIYDYLRTQKPVRNEVVRFEPKKP